MEDKTLNRLIEFCEEYSVESLTKDFQDKIKISINNLQQELSKANDKLEKIEEYIEESMKLGHHIDTNKSIYSIGINNILKIIKGDEDK